MKAMLACSETITKAMLPGLTYPLIASPKYDGIRALSMYNQPISRHAKLLPNKDLQYAFKHMPPLDGEVLVPGDFNKVQSAVMSRDTCIADKFSYFVFDTTEVELHQKRFDARMQRVEELAKDAPPQVHIAPMRICMNAEEVIAFYEESKAMNLGFLFWLSRGGGNAPGAPATDGSRTGGAGSSALKPGGALRSDRCGTPCRGTLRGEPPPEKALKTKRNALFKCSFLL